jgi:hypothetical protein
MKLYVKSATDISAIQAKIAKKEEDIRKKRQLIDKRNAAIDKQMKILDKYLNSDEIDLINQYIDYATEHGTYRMPEELKTWQISRDHEAEFNRDFSFADDPLYKIGDAVESIHSANTAIKEYQATLDKYNAQLDKIKKTNKDIDEIPDVLKDFMNQLVDEWDRYDKNIRDNSPAYYKELKAKMNELVPSSTHTKAGLEQLFTLYPEYKERYENADGYNKFYIRRYAEDDFNSDYLEKPFKKKFGVSTSYAMNLWDMSDEDIHKANLEDGKRIILDLVNRVTKITGPITSWSGLHLTRGNGGWAVLNGIVEGEDGRASVETILAGGYAIQRLHARTLVKKVG